jgi:hypothetical protein
MVPLSFAIAAAAAAAAADDDDDVVEADADDDNDDDGIHFRNGTSVETVQYADAYALISGWSLWMFCVACDDVVVVATRTIPPSLDMDDFNTDLDDDDDSDDDENDDEADDVTTMSRTCHGLERRIGWDCVHHDGGGAILSVLVVAHFTCTPCTFKVTCMKQNHIK